MIASPGFPQHYRNGIDCTWKIQMSIGQLIQFNFLHFDLLSYQDSSVTQDSLRIYDGDSNTSPMLGSYVGDSMPPSQISSSNQLFFHFHSDSEGTATGFKLEYNVTSKNTYKVHIMC